MKTRGLFLMTISTGNCGNYNAIANFQCFTGKYWQVDPTPFFTSDENGFIDFIYPDGVREKDLIVTCDSNLLETSLTYQWIGTCEIPDAYIKYYASEILSVKA